MTMDFTTAHKRARKSASTSQQSLSANISKNLFKSVLSIFNTDYIILNSKQVDSYLKPYWCKVTVYGNPCFFSFLILLCHKREAYSIHRHKDKPHLCTHEGCDRSVLGNGFLCY
jgi:hypothetical protein